MSRYHVILNSKESNVYVYDMYMYIHMYMYMCMSTCICMCIYMCVCIYWNPLIRRSIVTRYAHRHWQVQEVKHSQTTLHTSPSQASYGVSFVHLWEIINSVLLVNNHSNTGVVVAISVQLPPIPEDIFKTKFKRRRACFD